MSQRSLPRPSFLSGRSLESILDLQRWQGADVQYGTYVRPEGARGLAVVTLPCSGEELVVTSGEQTLAPGTAVALGSNAGSQGLFIASPPPPGRRGAAFFQVLGQTVVSRASFVRALDPFELEAGFVGTVSILGGGFLESPLQTFAAVVETDEPGVFEPDPDVTISSPLWISSTEVEATFTIASGAAGLPRPIDIEVSS